MLNREYRAMGIAMIVLGAAMAIAYPLHLANDKPGWVWDYPARNLAMEHMFVAVYATMGLFLILGARDPVRYLPFIDFVIVSGVAHASVMLYDALQLPGHVNHVHPGGDVIGILAVGGPCGAPSEETLYRAAHRVARRQIWVLPMSGSPM